MIVRQPGGTERLELATVPDPAPGPDQVRIAVHAASVNPVDAGNRADPSWAGLATPYVLGYDVAGVVDAVGNRVTGIRPGERVMAMTPFPSGAGGYAELAVVNANQLARIPDTVSCVTAAACPLAGGTALVVLDRLALAAGDWLLVLGASGGVGLFLVQLAAARGLRVIAVGRSGSHARLPALGAVACIDYTTEDVAAAAVVHAGGPVDAIAALVGGGMLAGVLPAVRRFGALASIATPDLDLDPVLDANLTFHGILIDDDGPRTRRLATLLGDGMLRPVVSHVLPLSDVADAHRILESKHTGGKVVLDLTR